jgi:hypothetical protein
MNRGWAEKTLISGFKKGGKRNVKVIEKATGKETVGKYAAIKAGEVGLFWGIMSDKKGGWRGCGKKTFFAAEAVTVKAEEPAKELKQG